MIWTVLLGLAWTILAGLVVAEVSGWLGRVADLVVDRAIGRLEDADARERYEAEWKAELDSLQDRRLTQLVTAARIFHRAAATNVALGHAPAQKRRRWASVERAFDLLAASTGLVVAAPALCVVAAAVTLTSPGPVVVRGWSIGRDGMPYVRLKFRTFAIVDVWTVDELAVGDDHVVDHHYVTPRRELTDVGRALRRLSLDELPGLWNVVKGDVSLRQLMASGQGPPASVDD